MTILDLLEEIQGLTLNGSVSWEDDFCMYNSVRVKLGGKEFDLKEAINDGDVLYLYCEDEEIH